VYKKKREPEPRLGLAFFFIHVGTATEASTRMYETSGQKPWLGPSPDPLPLHLFSRNVFPLLSLVGSAAWRS
jgi:hypothetical protein